MKGVIRFIVFIFCVSLLLGCDDESHPPTDAMTLKEEAEQLAECTKDQWDALDRARVGDEWSQFCVNTEIYSGSEKPTESELRAKLDSIKKQVESENRKSCKRTFAGYGNNGGTSVEYCLPPND